MLGRHNSPGCLILHLKVELMMSCMGFDLSV